MEFTAGMLGVHFDTSSDAMVQEIDTAMTVFAHGLEALHRNPRLGEAAKEAMVHRWLQPDPT